MGRGVRNQYIAATAACLSVLTSASCYGWITPLLPRLLDPSSELPLTPAELPWVISVIELGFLLSSLPAGILSSYVGRKMMLLSSAPLFILSWTVLLGYPSAFSLAVSRFIQGMSIGIVSTVAPEYLAEIASPQSKTVISGMYGSVWWLGVLLEYSVGLHTTVNSFTYFTMLLNIPFCLLFIWQPDSPTFYLLVGDEERATRSLLWFRDGTTDVIKREVDELKANLEINRKATSFRELVATSIDRQGLAVMLVMVAVRGLSGHSVVVVYATHIFSQIPSVPCSPGTATLALGIVMFVTNLFGMVLADGVGRRPLLLFSCLGSLICHLVTGTYFFFLSLTSVDMSGLALFPTLAIMIYSGIHCASTNPVSMAYTSELFRAPVRGLAVSVNTLITTLIVFGLLSIYEPMLKDVGMCANFYLYAFASFIGLVYFYLFAPETKGKSFFQIRKELCSIPKTARSSEMEPLFSDDDDDVQSL